MSGPNGTGPLGPLSLVKSFDERSLEDRPMVFSVKHVDPLIWGVCTCEVCWYERVAKRQADAAERAAARQHALTGMQHWENFIHANDALVGFVCTSIGAWSLWAMFFLWHVYVR